LSPFRNAWLQEMGMEEATRLHNDVPFGWALALQRMLFGAATHRVDQSKAPWRQDEAKPHLLPDDLPHLTAPR
jgi:hypothetical protein